MPPLSAPPASPTARRAIVELVASQIREVANAGMGDPAILPFWFGEPDEVTPPFIRDAATAALARGETFYTENLGIPELRETIAGYVSRLHRPTPPGEIAVTASGMSALMLCVEALVGPGDRVVVVTPLWPNLPEIPKILGADVVRVPLAFGPAGWTLDADRLLAALTPGTRALMINSPNNPTGWTLDAATQGVILAHCRRHGIWIIADDVYERLWYGHSGGGVACAPSFLDLAADGDRLVSTNSFSKSWLMTGWRLGWIVAPERHVRDLEKLAQNLYISPATVSQRAALACFLPETLAMLETRREAFRARRDFLVPALRELGFGIPVLPTGGFFVYADSSRFSADSQRFCREVLEGCGVAITPGIDFGTHRAAAHVRFAYTIEMAKLEDGVARLSRFLRRG